MKKLEKNTYEVRKNIVYCVHIEIENAVRCTRKEQWSRNEFCWLRCFFSVICPEGMVRDGSYVHGVFTENYRLKKGENVCQEIREKV